MHLYFFRITSKLDVCFHQSIFLFEDSQPFLNEKGFMFLQMSRFHQSFFLFEESQPFQPKKDFFAVCTGFEPVTPCVVGGARVELARGVLNIHLTLISVPTILYSATTIVNLYG